MSTAGFSIIFCLVLFILIRVNWRFEMGLSILILLPLFLSQVIPVPQQILNITNIGYPETVDLDRQVQRENEPCLLLLNWSVGYIDPQFQVSEDDVIHSMNRVVNLWATAVDSLNSRQLEEGGVTVQLVYDDRQERSRTELQLRETLQSKRALIDQLKEQHNARMREYVEQSAEYLQLETVYTGRVDRLNDWILEINEAGGFSEPEWDQLRAARSNLQEMLQIKDDKRDELNTLVDKLNDLTISLNQIIHDRNMLVADYNSEFSTGDRFVSGTYERRGGQSMITVYQFMTLHELELVLAHEFGHALGIDHVSNPQSVMFELMADQSYFTQIELTEEDKAAARALCP